MLKCSAQNRDLVLPRARVDHCTISDLRPAIRSVFLQKPLEAAGDNSAKDGKHVELSIYERLPKFLITKFR